MDNFICQLEGGEQKRAVVWKAGIQRGVLGERVCSPRSVLYFLYLRGIALMSDMKRMHGYVRCFDEAAECDDS
jgi:hypothetical protein